jgi:cation transport regulator ChaB
MELEKIEDVLQVLMYELPQRVGNYYFRHRSIIYKEDIIMAFQYAT